MKKMFSITALILILGMCLGMSSAHAESVPYAKIFGQKSSVTCDVNCNAGIDYESPGDVGIGFGIQTGGDLFVGVEGYFESNTGLNTLAFVGVDVGGVQLKAGGGYFSSKAAGNFGADNYRASNSSESPGLMVEAKFSRVFMRVIGYKADYDFYYLEQTGVNPVTSDPVYTGFSDAGKSKVILYQVGVQFDG